VAEALTAPIDPGTASDYRREGIATIDESFVRPAAIHTRSPVADLKLRLALAAFDRAQSWKESQEAQRRLLALGPEVVPSVLAELAEPQPPERFDVLVALLVKWKTADEAMDLARSEGAGWVLRASLAEALGHYADALHARDARTRERIASVLAHLARDSNAGVRIAAVEAIGLAKLTADPQTREVLRHVASGDPNADVKNEAQTVLEQTD
jgi:hypothetical protein